MTGSNGSYFNNRVGERTFFCQLFYTLNYAAIFAARFKGISVKTFVSNGKIAWQNRI